MANRDGDRQCGESGETNGPCADMPGRASSGGASLLLSLQLRDLVCEYEWSR